MRTSSCAKAAMLERASAKTSCVGDDVEPARVGREDGEDKLDGNVLDDHALVPFGGGLHGGEPLLARADGGHLGPPLTCEPESPLDGDLLGVLGDAG